jgi:hypothetical protein
MFIDTNMKQAENSMEAHEVYLKLSDNEALKETIVSHGDSSGLPHIPTE